jgi:hypothetical protein
MATAFVRVQATVPSDPVKKSRSYDAPLRQGYLSATLRSTQEGRSMVASQTVLAVPPWKSPQFNGRFFLK